MPTEKRYLRPDEVADPFRVDLSTVWKWIRIGRLGHVNTPSGRIRVPASEMERIERPARQANRPPGF